MLNTPHLSIDDRTNDRMYGAYLSLYLLTHTNRVLGEDADTRIGDIWRAAASQDSLEALETAVRTVLRYSVGLGPRLFWSDYYRALWNGLPSDIYQSGDGLTLGARLASDDPGYSDHMPIPVRLDGAQQRVYELKADLRHASSRYYHFTFPDTTVRSVYFFDGLVTGLSKDSTWIGRTGSDGTEAYKLGGKPVVPDPLTPPYTRGASVQVLYKVEGGDWREYDTNYALAASFCRDAKAERISDLVVILGNTDIERDYVLQPAGLKPVLQVSNLACWQWSGTVTMEHQIDPGVTETTTAQVTLRRPDVAAPPPPPQPDFMPMHLGPYQTYFIQSGSVGWEVHGSYQGCSYSGSASWAVTNDSQDEILHFETVNASLAGPWHRGYYVMDAPWHEAIGQVTCDESPYEAPFQFSWFDTRNDSTPNAVPVASANGTALNGSAVTDGGFTTYTWSLQADREP